MNENYYEILELSSKKCSLEEIKTNYRRLCKLYHPDKGGSHEKFVLINTAFNTLSDSQKRFEYDKLNGFNEDYKSTPLYRRYKNVKDIRDTINLTISEAYHGCSRHLKIIQNQMDHNRNWTKVEYDMDQYIPPGISEGEQIIIPDKGNKFPNFSGDVILDIKIINDSGFEINGSNLIYTITLPLKRALCGAKITIPHISGTDLTVTIKHVISDGYQYSLKGYGMPIRGTNAKGELTLVFKIKYPISIIELDENVKQVISDALPD